MRTVKEAAAALGIDGNTLRDWLRKAGAGEMLERDPVDARLVYVPDDILEQLAEAHKRRLVYTAPDLASEVAELRRRVEALERNAALGSLRLKSEAARATYQHSDVSSSEAPESRPTRARRGNPDASPEPALASIADGWVRSVTFARAHGIHPNTFRHWIESGAVEVTRRPDRSRSDDRDEIWLTPEQQAAALELARQRGHAS